MKPEPIYPRALHVSGSVIEEFTEEDWETVQDDPRGLLLMWEPPQHGVKYIMGSDPTEGITGWSRATRVPGDTKTDNGVIEVFQPNGTYELLTKEVDGKKVPDIDPITNKPRRLYKDVQIAEFAAPCDAVELARIANIIGRIYKGDEEDQCELIWEAWPGPGLLMTQELLRLNYGNLWHWEYIDSVAEETNRLGWRSTRESQKALWYRSRRHLMGRHALIRSRFLLDEYSNAEIDMEKMRARAAYGFHDDRFQAANMCFWAGHKWTYEVDSSHEQVTENLVQDYQRMAPSCSVSFERGLEIGDSSYSSWKERATEDWWE